jgi:hypothetical protein
MPSRRTPSVFATNSCVITSWPEWNSVERRQQPAAQLPLVGKSRLQTAVWVICVMRPLRGAQRGSIGRPDRTRSQQVARQPIRMTGGKMAAELGVYASHEQRNTDDPSLPTPAISAEAPDWRRSAATRSQSSESAHLIARRAVENLA